MAQNDNGLQLEDLQIKPHLITKLKGAGIESIFDLAISIPHQLIQEGGILTGADTNIALDIVMKAKKALIDSGLLAKDFSTAEEILERRNNVRDVLRDADVEVARYEGDGSLVIVDSVKGYFGSETDLLCLIKILSKRAQNQGTSGCSVFADMGSFYVCGKVKQLLEYEASMPLKFDCYHVGGSLIKCKAFCMYHRKDFNRLAEDEKQSLFQQHYRNLIVSGRLADWKTT